MEPAVSPDISNLRAGGAAGGTLTWGSSRKRLVSFWPHKHHLHPLAAATGIASASEIQGNAPNFRREPPCDWLNELPQCNSTAKWVTALLLSAGHARGKRSHDATATWADTTHTQRKSSLCCGRWRRQRYFERCRPFMLPPGDDSAVRRVLLPGQSKEDHVGRI